jgi:hypothetical protein
VKLLLHVLLLLFRRVRVVKLLLRRRARGRARLAAWRHWAGGSGFTQRARRRALLHRRLWRRRRCAGCAGGGGSLDRWQNVLLRPLRMRRRMLRLLLRRMLRRTLLHVLLLLLLLHVLLLLLLLLLLHRVALLHLRVLRGRGRVRGGDGRFALRHGALVQTLRAVAVLERDPRTPADFLRRGRAHLGVRRRGRHGRAGKVASELEGERDGLDHLWGSRAEVGVEAQRLPHTQPLYKHATRSATAAKLLLPRPPPCPHSTV